MQKRKAIINPYMSSVTARRRDGLVDRSPIYYGWVIMLAGTLGMIMTSPGQTYAVSIFIEHFITDLGISRSLVSTLYSAGTLIGSFALPLVGRQIDRRGSRTMTVVISVLFGLACIAMGFVQNAVMLGLGFIAIRMLGQGSLGIVSTNVVNQWWVRRRGTVLGISGVMVALLGLGGFPNLISWLIPIYGWRWTYAILGLMLLIIMAPVGYFLFRNNPEAHGLQPDGDKPLPTESGESDAQIAEENWTLAEAIRTPAFWIVISGLGAISMLGTGLYFHMVSIFEDSGLNATIAASVFLPIAITTAAVNLGSGFLIDRIPVRVLLALALVMQAASLGLAQLLQGVQWAILYGLVLGTMGGLMRTVSTVVWASYFGRKYLGSITGVASTMLVLSSALGPMPFGIARDMLGSYRLILSIGAVIPAVLAIISLFVREPRKATDS